MVPSLPSVTLIVATFNEAAFIDDCLVSLEAQDYAGQIAIVIADGGSDDGTPERIGRWHDRLDLVVIANPHQRQAPGLNRAAAAANGEILIRIDAHTTYAADYVSASIRALREPDVHAAGGALRPMGKSRFGRAVAAAMRSPLAAGPAKFHREDAAGDVDTVYLGAFSRDDFTTLAGFRAFPSGAGEDADFYFRMRRRGWRVYLDPSIRSEYRPRENLGALWRQHFRYGQAKAELLWANRVFPSLRPLAPALLVAALVGGVAMVPTVGWWPLIAIAGTWLAALLVVGAATPALLALVVLATKAMHLGYGLGLWWGILRGPRRVRRAFAAGEAVREA